MTFNRKFSILTTGFTVLIALFLFYPQKKCNDYSQTEVIDAVKNDFLKNRMPTWTTDSEYLGTNEPNIIFDKEDISISDAYLIPFIAKGKSTEIKYFAIYSCKNGNIEYSLNKGG